MVEVAISFDRLSALLDGAFIDLRLFTFLKDGILSDQNRGFVQLIASLMSMKKLVDQRVVDRPTMVQCIHKAIIDYQKRHQAVNQAVPQRPVAVGAQPTASVRLRPPNDPSVSAVSPTPLTTDFIKRRRTGLQLLKVGEQSQSMLSASSDDTEDMDMPVSRPIANNQPAHSSVLSAAASPKLPEPAIATKPKSTSATSIPGPSSGPSLFVPPPPPAPMLPARSRVFATSTRPVSSQRILVDPKASDGTALLPYAHRCRTIREALVLADAGATIVVVPATYLEEPLCISKPGITLQALREAGAPVGDLPHASEATAARRPCIVGPTQPTSPSLTVDAPFVTVQGFLFWFDMTVARRCCLLVESRSCTLESVRVVDVHVEGVSGAAFADQPLPPPSNRLPRTGIEFGPNSSGSLSNCHVSRVDIGLVGHVGTTISANHCSFRNCNYSGVYLNAAHRATFVSSEVVANRWWGLFCTASSDVQVAVSTQVTMRSCQVSENGRDGLYLDVAARVVVAGCTIQKNRQIGVVVSQGVNIEFVDCIVSHNGQCGMHFQNQNLRRLSAAATLSSVRRNRFNGSWQKQTATIIVEPDHVVNHDLLGVNLNETPDIALLRIAKVPASIVRIQPSQSPLFAEHHDLTVVEQHDLTAVEHPDHTAVEQRDHTVVEQRDLSVNGLHDAKVAGPTVHAPISDDDDVVVRKATMPATTTVLSPPRTNRRHPPPAGRMINLSNSPVIANATPTNLTIAAIAPPVTPQDSVRNSADTVQTVKVETVQVEHESNPPGTQLIVVGEDSVDGATTRYESIRAALAVARTGATVLVSAGTYAESALIIKVAGLTLAAVDGAEVTISGPELPEQPLLTVIADRVSLRELHFRFNQNIALRCGIVIAGVECLLTRINFLGVGKRTARARDNEWNTTSLLSPAIRWDVSSSGVMQSCEIRESIDSGMICEQNAAVEVRNSNFRNNRFNGVHLRHSGKSILESCEFTENGRYGAFCDAKVPARFTACLFANNGKDGAYFDFPTRDSKLSKIDRASQLPVNHVVRSCEFRSNGESGVAIVAGVAIDFQSCRVVGNKQCAMWFHNDGLRKLPLGTSVVRDNILDGSGQSEEFTVIAESGHIVKPDKIRKYNEVSPADSIFIKKPLFARRRRTTQ